MDPAEGDRRLTSAMTATVWRRRAPAKESGVAAARASCSSAVRLARTAPSRPSVDRSISSRVTGILSFGRYSGTLIRALFGRTVTPTHEILMPLTKRQSEILGYLQ